MWAKTIPDSSTPTSTPMARSCVETTTKTTTKTVEQTLAAVGRSFSTTRMDAFLTHAVAIRYPAMINNSTPQTARP